MEPVFADIALDHKLGGVVWPTTEAVSLFVFLFSHLYFYAPTFRVKGHN